MALSQEQIKEVLKKPQSSAQLAKARSHEEKLRFHAEEVQDRSDASRYADIFLPWAKSKLAGGKADMFEWALQFPLYTTEIIKAISEEYQKVYNAENSSFTYLFSNEETEAQFINYLSEIDFWKRWKDVSSDAMLRRINSIIIIDMPEDSKDTEPYYYFLPIESVKDIGTNGRGGIEWLMVTAEDNNYFVFDDTSYKLVDKDGNILNEAFHPLGYCPACFFWQDPIKRGEPVVKRSPISAALNNLNWLLYWETSRRCLEVYAAYPILASYKEKCDYKTVIDDIGEVSCKGGILDLRNGTVWDCPVCAKNKFVGGGTHLRLPMLTPEGQNQTQMSLEAARYINVDVGSLDYCTRRSAEIWDEVYYDCVGFDGDAISNQAVNVKQVKAHFESKQNILMNLKENLETSHTFIIYTIAKLKFGDSFVDCSINYGSNFYLQTDSELTDKYSKAKAAGSPQYQLDNIRHRLDSAITKGNEDDEARVKILRQLEPFTDLSIQECKALALDAVSEERFLLKADFSRLILKFETDYGDIVNFGSKLNPDVKINKILTKLLEYVKNENSQSGQTKTEETASASQQGAGTEAAGTGTATA